MSFGKGVPERKPFTNLRQLIEESTDFVTYCKGRLVFRNFFFDPLL